MHPPVSCLTCGTWLSVCTVIFVLSQQFNDVFIVSYSEGHNVAVNVKNDVTVARDKVRTATGVAG